uniref:mS53 n=1 Tax=Trypanosoma brucei brucei TaxID=5702 RepID=UPI00122C1319|nr:Chain DF, mS53 [Trypanosoma brucei brucei]6SGB_DF Chain DF, mS53 [Trypanosoma brucei brucei]
MSVSGVFSKGRGIGHEATTSILRYIPRARVPWQPSRFGRENLTAADMARLWSRGRYRDGPGNYNSGYCTERTHVLEENTVSIIPRRELEKYMPDITIGPKALVTPVSLMNARNGHRVTHDLLHSYDPHIGRLGKPAVVDHDNITVEDPNRVGLNAATLDCRGRIYRWLRRGPFFQVDNYFRRSVKLNRDGTLPTDFVHEAPLMRKIIRLAHRGHLKAACEEYRRVTTVPPVEVYRALTACCVPGAKLADAVSIFEDGDSKLFYVSRDGEVLHNLMRCAIAARHRARIMWVYNVMRGRFYENVVVRAEVDLIWRYRIAMIALEYLLDHECAEEAAAIYSYLVEEELLRCDVHVRVGLHMREAIAAGKPITLNNDVMNATSLVRDATAVAPEVARELQRRHAQTLQNNAVEAVGAENVREGSAPWSILGPLTAIGPTAEDTMVWLQQHYGDVDVMSIMRWARFRKGKDLMAKDRPQYLARAAAWIELLSKRNREMEEVPLTYMRKSKPLVLDTNSNVRVAWQTPLMRSGGPPRLLAREEGYVFHHSNSSRFVEETYRHPGESLQSRYLALQPLHTEVSAKEDFQRLYYQAQKHHKQQERLLPVSTAAIPSRIVHHSVMSALHGVSGKGEPANRSLFTGNKSNDSHSNTGVASGTSACTDGAGSATPEF